MAETVDPVLDKDTYLCNLQVSPRVITGWLLNFCMWKFSKERNLMDPALRKAEYLWTEDDMNLQTMTKGILIATAYQYDPTDAQQRPALIVKRDRSQLGPRQSIGDKFQTPQNLIGSIDPNKYATIGHTQQVVALAGTHTIYCAHRTGAAAELLGEEMWHSLVEYMHVARQDLGLDEFRPSDFRAAEKIREFNDNWATSIVINYKYQRVTTIRSEAPILKAIGTILAR